MTAAAGNVYEVGFPLCFFWSYIPTYLLLSSEQAQKLGLRVVVFIIFYYYCYRYCYCIDEEHATPIRTIDVCEQDTYTRVTLCG
ncbi:hypothetical protein F4775DRAFT_558568, partial [Biscogniauxia sp. FL1348]